MNTTRTYQYDTLGNLIREEQDGCVEYKYNGAHLDESTKCGTIPNSIGTSYWEYTYDNRGNLVSRDKYTRTTSGMAWQNEAAYTYDETNRMVSGKNEQGEYSIYTYNGLGMRVGRELIMKDNTHGYTDFHDLTPSVDTGLTTPEVAVESYVIDYTSPTFDPLTMDEDGGFSYRYVYGLNTLSVKITSEGTNWWGQHVTTDILKDYLHQDRLGSTTNLTDKFGRVVGRADYNEWGEITYREALTITSSYRRIYPQSSYTGHDWDDVLGMYYAKARFYSAEDKRFVAVDPVKGQIIEPLSLVPYVYCVDNPLRWVDPLGLRHKMPIYLLDGILAHIAIEFVVRVQNPEAKLQTYVKGVERTDSKKGYPDIMIPNEGYHDIYEIKPISHHNDLNLRKLASDQLQSYVDAIQKNPTISPNKNYYPARRGTDLLGKINDMYITFPISGRVLHIKTYPKGDPDDFRRDDLTIDKIKKIKEIDERGMIYYEILDCDEVPETVTVITPDYDKETKNRIQILLHSADETPDYYYTDATYADNDTDKEYYNYVTAIGGSITQWTQTYGGIQYTKLQSPFFGDRWRVDGLQVFGQPIETEKLSPVEIYLIYQGGSQYQQGWYEDPQQAFISWLISSGLPVTPGGVPELVPAF